MIGRTNTEPETSAQMRSFAMHSAYFCSLLNVACASFDWAQALNSFDLGMMFSVILRSWHELLQFLLVLELQCPFWIFASFSWCIYCCWCCLIPRQHVSMQGPCLPLPPCPHAKAMPPKTPRKKTRTADAFAKKLLQILQFCEKIVTLLFHRTKRLERAAVPARTGNQALPNQKRVESTNVSILAFLECSESLKIHETNKSVYTSLLAHFSLSPIPNQFKLGHVSCQVVMSWCHQQQGSKL